MPTLTAGSLPLRTMRHTVVLDTRNRFAASLGVNSLGVSSVGMFANEYTRLYGRHSCGERMRVVPRLASKFRRQELEAEQARLLRKALAEANVDADEVLNGNGRRRVRARAGGDPRSLRGLPVVGSGMGGVIPGTRPGDSLGLNDDD